MSYYTVYDLVIDGVIVCTETIVTVVTKCVVSFVVVLLLGYINKMFNIGDDSEDSDDLTRIADVVPYTDTQFSNMTARAYRKHITMLERQIIKLQMYLETAYTDIAALKRENDAFRRINSQAHHLITEFKRKNSRLFLKPKTSDTTNVDDKNQIFEFGEELPTEGAEAKRQTFQDDYVCIRDGDKFVFGKPIYTNYKVTDADAATEAETTETDSERGLCLRSAEARTNVQSSTVESGSTTDVSNQKQLVFICPPVNTNSGDSIGGDATSLEDVIYAMTPPPQHIYVDVGAGEHDQSQQEEEDVTKNCVLVSADVPVASDDNSASGKTRSVPKSMSDSKLYIHSESSSSTSDRSSYERRRSNKNSEDDETEEEEETSKEDSSSRSSTRGSNDSEARRSDISHRHSEEDLTVTPEDTDTKISSTEAETYANDESDTLPSTTSDLPDTFVVGRRLITESDAFKKFIRSTEATMLSSTGRHVDFISPLNVFSVFNRPK